MPERPRHYALLIQHLRRETPGTVVRMRKRCENKCRRSVWLEPRAINDGPSKRLPPISIIHDGVT
jgi:hypothetical protein